MKKKYNIKVSDVGYKVAKLVKLVKLNIHSLFVKKNMKRIIF